MKTVKILSLKSLAHFIGFMALSLMVFSCGKNNDNGNNNNVYANCAGCAGIANGQPFFSSQSTDITYGLTMNLNFVGNTGGYNANGQQQYGQQYGSTIDPIVSYSGIVAAQGVMTLSQSIGSNYGGYGQGYGSCFLPAGTYSITTAQPGQWSQAIVSGLVLNAIGPASAIIQISQAQVAAKSQLGATWNEVAPVGRLFGDLVIQSVNGIQCNLSTLLQ